MGTAIVTGGGRGLGRAIALSLADQGHAVGILARTASQVEDVSETIRARGGRALPLVADVRDLAAMEAGVRHLRENLGPIDVVIAAAGQLRGIGPLGLPESDPDAGWSDLETAVKGLWNTVHATLDDLKRSSQGVLVTLVGPGVNGILAHAAGYAAGQSAVARLVECLAAEWRSAGLPIYAVNPGLVPTALMQHLLDSPQGRRWLPGFTEAFAEGKEVDEGYAVRMVSWLVRERPLDLSGRVVPALLDPELLDLRRATLHDEDRLVLRLR
jgi:3-oxoacyl-[acyl-carrier protein] reductase